MNNEKNGVLTSAMVREILIVTANRQVYQRIEETCKQSCDDNYSFTIARNTQSAADRLREHSVALVLLDRLPEEESMIAFLFYIWGAFPDIPVLNLSGEQKFPESLMIEEKGITIPSPETLPLNEWPAAIDKALKREQEGGFLFVKEVSNFAQMIQNEVRTCTLRVLDHTGSRLGILFFEKGELKNARLKTVQGEIAAYALLSWENVKICIQNSCDISVARIRSNLQALLIESQVKKDHEEKPYSSSTWIDAAQEEKKNYQKLIDRIPAPRISAKETEAPVLSTPPESGITKILHHPMTTGITIVLVLFMMGAYLVSSYIKDSPFKRSLPPRHTVTQPVPVTEKTAQPDISAPEQTKKQDGLSSKVLESLPDASQLVEDAPKNISSTEEVLPVKEKFKPEATPRPRLFTVYLHYGHPENRHLAYQLAEHLMTGNFVVPKIELVKYSGNNIRFFHAADQDLAMDLKMQVIDFLKEFLPHKDTVKFKMKNLAKVYPQVPRGQLEIWLNLSTQ